MLVWRSCRDRAPPSLLASSHILTIHAWPRAKDGLPHPLRVRCRRLHCPAVMIAFVTVHQGSVTPSPASIWGGRPRTNANAANCDHYYNHAKRHIGRAAAGCRLSGSYIPGSTAGLVGRTPTPCFGPRWSPAQDGPCQSLRAPTVAACTRSLIEWRGGIAALIEAGQRNGDVTAERPARELAESLLALIQGAFVVGLSTRDDAAMRSIADSIDAMLAPTRSH